jgi:hypothetical protein
MHEQNAHTEDMRRRRLVGGVFAFCAVTLLVVVLAPAVLLFGELVNRRYWRMPVSSYTVMRGVGVWTGRRTWAAMFFTNPVWIALTAPGRWLVGRLRPRAGSGRRRGGNGDPGAGVREPRRPLPDLPAGAMALPEPREFG